MEASGHQSRISGFAMASIEIDLWNRYVESRDEKLRWQLFDYYSSLSKSVARKYFRPGHHGTLELEELFQMGCAGLLEAIDRYDPTQGVPFRYYASRRISGSILNGISRHNEISNLLSFRKRAERDRLNSLKREPAQQADLDDTLAMLGEVVAELAVGLLIEEISIASDLREDQGASPYESAAWNELIRRAGQEWALLPERERRIVQLHYREGVDFTLIGRMLGLSKGRVSQLHRSALETLRKRLLGAGQFSLNV